MTTSPQIAGVPAGLAGLLVLWRVVASSVGTLLAGPIDGLVTVATVVLLVAALAFVAAVVWFCLRPTGAARSSFERVLVTFLVVMGGYLVLGVALGLFVPWTAYATLAGVAVLGLSAVALAGRADPGQ